MKDTLRLPITPLTLSQKKRATAWFKSLQEAICTALETLEKDFTVSAPPQTFRRKSWKRPGGGGGTMAILEGALFEKAGVNVSEVFGSPDEGTFFSSKAQNFWASGLSLVVHPRSPHIPMIHMNTRLMEGDTFWFGGGIDLTPVFPNTEDTTVFHGHLKKICDTFDKSFYPTFKKEADTYFFLPHRNEARGIGGIFYDNLQQDFEDGFALTKAVGEALIDIYRPLVKRHWRSPFSAEDKEAQLHKRARYAEFNLLYDKGTVFGLKTKGFIDAIFMPLPPLAAWPSPLKEG